VEQVLPPRLGAPEDVSVDQGGVGEATLRRADPNGVPAQEPGVTTGEAMHGVAFGHGE